MSEPINSDGSVLVEWTDEKLASLTSAYYEAQDHYADTGDHTFTWNNIVFDVHFVKTFIPYVRKKLEEANGKADCTCP